MSKYIIYDQLLHEIEDSPQWLGVVLFDAVGDTIDELKENLMVSIMDQDGGERNSFGYEDAYRETRDIIDNLIKELKVKS